jgi:hypothetical protein
MTKRAKPDEYPAWDLHFKKENQKLEFELLDKQASVAKNKIDLDEKQLVLDERRFALDKHVHQLNLAQQDLANDECKIANEKLKLANDKLRLALYAKETALKNKEKALENLEKTLDEKEKVLDDSEELLRESKYVCSVCLQTVPGGALRALDPCGHCFCTTCVHSQGIIVPVLGDPIAPYEGTCPTCRAQVDTVLTLFL